jgi:hypothetical protein
MSNLIEQTLSSLKRTCRAAEGSLGTDPPRRQSRQNLMAQKIALKPCI